MDINDYIIDFFMDYGAIIYPIGLLSLVVLYNRLKGQKAPEQYGFRQGTAPNLSPSNPKQSPPEQRVERGAGPMLKNLDTNHDGNDEYDEDEDLLPELDYEKDDPDRDFGILEGDDEYDENDGLTEAEDPDADESDDPSQYDRYMGADQGKAEGREAPTTIKSHQVPDEKRLLKKRRPAQDQLDPLVIMYLTPRAGQQFQGYELLQALSNYGVHLSEKKHFQRFTNDNGSGDLWYHVASMTHPGTFEMDEPGKLSCSGLVFILETKKVAKLAQAYECMLETASALATDLHGQLLDDKQAPLDENVIRKIKYYIAKHQVAETLPS